MQHGEKEKKDKVFSFREERVLVVMVMEVPQYCYR